jgi:hypothetical protein
MVFCQAFFSPLASPRFSHLAVSPGFFLHFFEGYIFLETNLHGIVKKNGAGTYTKKNGRWYCKKDEGGVGGVSSGSLLRFARKILKNRLSGDFLPYKLPK